LNLARHLSKQLAKQADSPEVHQDTNQFPVQRHPLPHPAPERWDESDPAGLLAALGGAISTSGCADAAGLLELAHDLLYESHVGGP